MWQRSSDNRWCERITINGRKKLITAKSKAELSRKLKDAATYIEHGRTFKECAQAWEDAHSATIEHKTVQSYRSHVKRSIEHFRGKYIKDITPDEVQAYIEKLASMRFARETVGRALGVLSQIFNHEILQPDASIRFNPCAAVRVPKNLLTSCSTPASGEESCWHCVGRTSILITM